MTISKMIVSPEQKAAMSLKESILEQNDTSILFMDILVAPDP